MRIARVVYEIERDCLYVEKVVRACQIAESNRPRISSANRFANLPNIVDYGEMVTSGSAIFGRGHVPASRLPPARAQPPAPAPGRARRLRHHPSGPVLVPQSPGAGATAATCSPAAPWPGAFAVAVLFGYGRRGAVRVDGAFSAKAGRTVVGGGDQTLQVPQLLRLAGTRVIAFDGGEDNNSFSIVLEIFVVP